VFTEKKTGLDVVYHTRSRSTTAVKQSGQKFQRLLQKFHHPEGTDYYITTDHEITYHKLEEVIQWANVSQSAPDQHAKQVERKIRTLRGKMRTVIQSLPYQLPTKLYRELLNDIIIKDNYTPNTLSGSLSPMTRCFGKNISYNHLINSTFGKMVIAKIPNSQITGSLDAQGEMGVVVGFEPSRPENLKVFVPSRNNVVIRQKTIEIFDSPELKTLMNDIAADNISTHFPDDSGESINSVISSTDQFDIVNVANKWDQMSSKDRGECISKIISSEIHSSAE